MKTFVILSALFLFTACVHKDVTVSREPSALRPAIPVDLLALAGRYKVVGECEIDHQEVTGLRAFPDRNLPGILNLVFFNEEEVWAHQLRAGAGRGRDFSAPFQDAVMEWATSLDGQSLKSIEAVYRSSDPSKKVTRNFTIGLSGLKMSMSYETNSPEPTPAGGKVSSHKEKEKEEEEDDDEKEPDLCRFLRR